MIPDKYVEVVREMCIEEGVDLTAPIEPADVDIINEILEEVRWALYYANTQRAN